MKQLTTLFLICLASLSKADVTGVTAVSETNRVFFIAITGAQSATNDAVPFDKRLVWMTYCSTNTGGALIELDYPDPRYGRKIRMIGPDGKDIPKTSMGESYGSRWNQLYSRKDIQFSSISAGGPYQPNIGAGGGQFLPAPKDLFNMTKPGIYTMEIQMQMFRYSPSRDPEEQHRNLIQFPPIKIKVEKPPEK